MAFGQSCYSCPSKDHNKTCKTLNTIFREEFLMELLSAILGDLVSRSITFMIDRYFKQTSVDDDLRRLHHLLLRIRTVVEEAEQRHLTNHGMIRQIELLREQMFRGYCILDVFRFRDEEDKVRPPFALSKFNRAKRIRLSDSSNSSDNSPIRARSMDDLHQTVSSLERIMGDTKESVVFLMSYPPIYRQPYSMHLYLDRCMFSRHMERENAISFLLQTGPPAAEIVQVLPVFGPALVGKSTFVEHICSDQRVREHFPLILYYSGDDLTDEKVATFRENCQTMHRNDAMDGRFLLVIELLGDVDDRTLKKVYSSFRNRKHMTREMKVIITSRSEKIVRLGTTQALRLKFLPFEAYWYLFKVLAFGSTDPEEHPKLASMAMEIAEVLRDCFLCAHIGGALLKANFSAQFWSRILAFAREYRNECNSLVSCGCQENVSGTGDHPQLGWAIVKPKPAKYFLLRDSYQKAPAQDDGSKITLVDLLLGRVRRRGKFEVLVWKSRIPPYYSYISNCVM
ncbi:disease resistance protein RGA2-like [Oryza brachyantha]|uniref:Disease resistance N-terminal domain-containing protein n=1 Tax=Oryza brachyantha TaxID=4533 RepID=J3M962_ORYBR|nr:disease resistance protein RGA2-like [Oryza brachyantha]